MNKATNEISCQQTEAYDTRCCVTPSVQECQLLVQLTCEFFHYNADLPEVNTGFSVLFPAPCTQSFSRAIYLNTTFSATLLNISASLSRISIFLNLVISTPMVMIVSL